MVVIDTNVVSELMRLTPDQAVMAWFSAQDSADLYLTAVTEAELRADAAVATRDRADFEHCGITLIDPWMNGRGST